MNSRDTSLYLGLLGLLIMVGGAFFVLRSSESGVEPPPIPSMPTSSVSSPQSSSSGGVQYRGTVLAGTSSKLLDFTETDYQAAILSDTLVVLYFYANWCPICRAEFPKMQAAFDQLDTSGVVGFRVNFNDNETNATEESLARQFGVAYQHTKVFLRDGKQVLKAPDSWDTDRYLKEIRQYSND